MDGDKSGVNWRRWNFAFRPRANAETVIVLANPGTPSRSTCPLESSPIRIL